MTTFYAVCEFGGFPKSRLQFNAYNDVFDTRELAQGKRDSLAAQCGEQDRYFIAEVQVPDSLLPPAYIAKHLQAINA